MNYQQGDIITRKLEDTVQLWLSQRLVMEVCGITSIYLKRMRTPYKKSVRSCDLARAIEFMPDTGRSWRWAKVQGQFYYCLNNIPNRQPTRYRERFGDTEALLQDYQNALQNQRETSLEARFKQHLNSTYTQYLEYYMQIDVIRRVALAKACAVLDFIIENIDTYGGTKNAIFNDISPLLDKMDIAYIPHHPLRLKEKYDILRTTDHCIVDIINLPRTDNRNALEYNDPEVFSWVMQLRASGANYSNEHIIREIWKHCDRTSKQKPSRRWFGSSIFEQPKTKFLTAEKRFGYGSRKAQMYSGYIPLKNAIDAGDCWEIDATRVNIIAHQTKDKDGNNAEKYLYMIVIRDLYSGDIVGYDLAYSENKSAYMRALRMAVEQTGYLPYSMTTDRFPGHNTDEIQNLFKRMEAMGVQINITHDPKGKAKVERWFGSLQSVVLMGSKYYYGEGILSRRLSAHVSPEYLAEIKKNAKKEMFGYIEAYRECESYIEQWRNLAYNSYSRKYANVSETPKQLHDEAVKRNVIEVDEAKISMLFHRKKEVKLRNNGLISTEIDKTVYYFQIAPENYDIIANYTGVRVTMTYDVFTSDRVYLWYKDEDNDIMHLLCTAVQFEAIQGHGPTAELGRLSEARARERKIQDMKEQELEQLCEGSEEDLIMGRLSNKKAVNKAEDEYLNKPIAKVANSDISEDDNEEIKIDIYKMM